MDFFNNFLQFVLKCPPKQNRRVNEEKKREDKHEENP